MIKPNWKRFERDPEGYANSLTVKELVSILKKAANAYYNTGKLLVSDRAYDIALNVLRLRSPNNPFLKSIGFTPPNKKVTLPYPMPSMNKIYPDGSLNNWLKKHPGPYIISDKLDGISLLYDNREGVPKLYTRGNGTIGQNVSQILPYIKIKGRGKVCVRGELIVPKELFDRLAKNQKSFNLRSYINGLVMRNTPSPELRNAHFVAHSLLYPRLSLKSSLIKMKQLGFQVVPFTVKDLIDEEMLTNILEKRKKISKYEMDGLIVAQEGIYSPSIKNPEWAFAFKANLQEGIKTKVIKVIWNESRYGFLKPKIQVEPVTLDGVVVQYASAHNAKYVVDNGLGPGAIVTIIRSGGVIPKIQNVLKKVKPQMPDIPYEWTDTKVDIIAVDYSNKQTVEHLYHFLSTIGVEGVGKSTCQKLVKIGLDSPEKIKQATVNQFIQMPGFTLYTAKKLYDAIQRAFDNASLAQLLVATGYFGRGIGETRIASVLNKIPDLFTKKWKKSELREQLDLGKYTEQFLEGFPKALRFLKNINYDLSINKGKLTGKNVVFTGFRSKELEELVRRNGGTVSESVNVHSILVTKNHSPTVKYQRAVSLGIPIYTREEFLDFMEGK